MSASNVKNQDNQKNVMPKISKWKLDFNNRNAGNTPKPKSERGQKLDRTLADPPGYDLNLIAYKGNAGPQINEQLVMKKSWDAALAPIRQIPMNIFAIYMSGNLATVVPIIVVAMLLMRTCKALFYGRLRPILPNLKPTFGQKFCFFLGNLLNVIIALYKCRNMGLLPIYPSDWLTFLESPRQLEFSGGGFTLY